MIIAQERRKENIAEYLLYMWQVEDMIRAAQFDIEVIEQSIIGRFNLDDARHQACRDWYESLIKMMELEHIKEKGHMQICKNVLIRLTDLHTALLNSPRFAQYHAQYYQVLPLIVELRAKSGKDEQPDELEACFNALYGVMMLRLQGKEVSTDTQNALSKISYFIGMLAAYYKKDEEKPLFDND